MKNKIIALGLLVSLCLTGCGAPDRIKEAEKELDIEFLSSRAEVKRAVESKDKKIEESKNNIQLKEFVSEERRTQIQDLIECMKKLKEEYVIFNCNGDLFKYKEKPVEEVNINGSRDFHFEVHTGSQLEEVKKRLGEIGYEGLQDVNMLSKANNMMGAGYARISSDGVSFDFQKTGVGFDVDICLGNYDLYTPIQFADVLSQCYADGFIVRDVITGGYIEMFSLESSYNEPGNPYEKCVYVYFKDSKFLQMEIYVTGKGKTTDLIFSEREKATMVNLLSWISKDAAASEKFVSEITAEGEDKGEIGSCDWYRIQEKNWGDNEREMTFRFVER